MLNIIELIKNKVKEANTNGVIVPFSGGIDSAVVSELAYQAIGSKAIIVLMPIGDMPGLKDAKEQVNANNYNYRVIDLTDSYNTLVKNLNINSEIALINLKSRLRMITTYAIANEENLLVLGTSNASELLIGYFTKWGDNASDLSPISHLYKSQVYELAKQLNIPDNIIDKKPSADLYEGQYDEDELGFTYDQLESYVNKEELDTSVKSKIEQMIKKNMHKKL